MGRNAAEKFAATTAAIAFVGLAATAATAATPVAAPETTTSAATVSAAARQVGTFTGEYVDGAPVYRLPAVNVTASRAAALAATGPDAVAATAGSAPGAGAVPHAAATANVAPDRNVALDVAVAALGTLAAVALSFGLVAARRRRRQTLILPQPRQWVAAQPYVAPSIPAAPAAEPEPLAVSAPRAAVSLTELRAQELRERRRAARRGVDATQPDAA